MVQIFVNSMFQHGLIPTVNKPTRVTRNTATAIDHIITNSLINPRKKNAFNETAYKTYKNLFEAIKR